MSILITGATGFVGKTLLTLLGKKGIEKEDCVLVTGKPVDGYPCVIHNNYQYSPEMFKGYKIDTVIHLGATTPKGKGRITAAEYAQNITTTLGLLAALPDIPSKIIFGSSTSVYDAGQDEPISETTSLNTKDPYGLSKLFCEMILSDWCKDKNVILQILRFGPIYGPGEETYNKLAGTFLKKAMKGEDIHIFSQGNEFRSMIYVEDVCEMIWKAMQLEATMDPINVTNDEPIRIKAIAEIACRLAKSTSKICIENKGSLRSERYDNERMRRVLGVPCTSYEQGIEKLYEHFLKIEDTL